MAEYGSGSGSGRGSGSGSGRGSGRGSGSGSGRGSIDGETYLTDHAGSGSSPLLSEALLTTRDGITGYWDGNPNITPKTLPNDETYLDMLRPPSQALVLECELKDCFSVSPTGAAGQALLKLNADSICIVHRPNNVYFQSQLDWLRAYADLRGDRLAEIYEQVDDLLSFFGGLCFLDNGRRKYTLMLLDVVQRVTIHVETLVKYHCRQARPIDYAMEVQPMIQTPDHSSFPSGHAMEAFAIATVLHRLTTGEGPKHGVDNRALPFRLAQRIAANRTVAGVHFPVDSWAGAHVGCLVGEAVYAIANSHSGAPMSMVTGDFPQITDNKKTWPDTDARDFLLSKFPAPHTVSGYNVAQNKVVAEIWGKAKAEWS